MRIEVIGIEKFPEIKSGDKLSNIIIETCKKNSIQLRKNDIIVISQKVISKSENQIINISTIKPTSYAKKIALKLKKDPRIIEVILSFVVKPFNKPLLTSPSVIVPINFFFFPVTNTICKAVFSSFFITNSKLEVFFTKAFFQFR